ncbi:hypothetical protein [Microbacterium sp. PRC9]|uniref:hypothetical protein n=1 Tax=Microbacterium sp. PRC9 TaxID=2962591 RepID=UPI0028818785|nr:hypothetical protein [Microbacterium sp. PRC9]MDT0143083.1 hypothetical protein [Microbacterium sp. PRC9]
MSRRFCRDDELSDNQEGKVDPAYLAEVGRMTAKREKLHRLRERRDAARAALVEAERALEAAQARTPRHRPSEREAWRLANQRRKELAALERLMTSYPGASARHRGTASIWAVSDPEGVQRGEPEPGPRVSDGRRHPVTVRKEARS